jgi:hypothetical protein
MAAGARHANVMIQQKVLNLLGLLRSAVPEKLE